MTGRFCAEADFDSVHAVHSGIPGRGAAQNFDSRAGKEAEMGQVVAYLFGQVDALQSAGLADLCFAQSHHASTRLESRLNES